MRISVEGLRRVRNRSVPPPPPFDPAALPDNAVITTRELAGWLRFSLSTLETWRLKRPDRGPPWILVAGQPRYRMGDVRKWLLTDPPPAGRRSVTQPRHLETQIIGQ
jgi:hypothetical protein